MIWCARGPMRNHFGCGLKLQRNNATENKRGEELSRDGECICNQGRQGVLPSPAAIGRIGMWPWKMELPVCPGSKIDDAAAAA